MEIGTKDNPSHAKCKAGDGHDTEPAASLVTSMIACLGLTFAEAESRIEGGDEEAVDIASAIHEAEPVTDADALIKLRILTGNLGLAGGSSPSFIASIAQVRDHLAGKLSSRM